MRIRTDIAELLRQGLNNAAIAEQVGVHHSTVARARQALRVPNAPRRPRLTQMDRLLLESLPTGLVRDYKPARMPISPQQAASNRARLEAALKSAA